MTKYAIKELTRDDVYGDSVKVIGYTDSQTLADHLDGLVVSKDLGLTVEFQVIEIDE